MGIASKAQEVSAFVRVLREKSGMCFEPAPKVKLSGDGMRLRRVDANEDDVSIETVSHPCGDFGRFRIFSWFSGRDVAAPQSVYHVVDTEGDEVAVVMVPHYANSGALNEIEKALKGISLLMMIYQTRRNRLLQTIRLDW